MGRARGRYGEIKGTAAAAPVAAARLPYEPRDPRRYRPGIGLIGCGGIAESHLRAYRAAGYDVVALCNRTVEKAERRRAEFFPRAAVYADYRDVLRRDDVDVVDVATPTAGRAVIVRAALLARKHVLSQKPFVTDLDVGQRLCDLADRQGVRLAVNQNGRWAPHFSYALQAIKRGLIGQVMSAHAAVHWDHGWTAGTPFDAVRHLVLFDFGIHWFDLITQCMGGRMAERVYASVARAPGQAARPPLLGQAIIEFEGGQASVVFDGSTARGPLDTTYVAGTRGSIRCAGPDLGHQAVTVTTARGSFSPKLAGRWFDHGFHGTMGELLRAIESRRKPSNGARGNLTSLALCFAAVRSADTGRPQVPGKVRRIQT